ncbi:glycoside hydrolase [Saccharothrix sp. ALI-22-I]|uniref:family 43 glycosylhydrolase n=1 Tax=Saccharothrix sp. ALI-22-I TaxID=1933778 RepID=UPI00097C969E|nr:family 43 glycosylhydrolase [Saccharothrix sp. ALI-22-I]ONI91286.1 glycoside hydrolase [Saccharothrix sp. ALI-22-I]
MQRRRRLLAWAVGVISALALLPATARADNPIVQHVYTADPAPMVHNGRVYVYTGRDEDGSTTFNMREWRVFSSADMVNWTDHGVPMNLGTFAWADANAWAGHTIERNGKFYWYVPVRRRGGGMAIGVGVADSPTGPFRDAIGRPLVENGEIDPAAFIDDNGEAYLYWGNPNLWYVRLNADMISFSGSPTRIPLTAAGFGARTGNPSRPTLYEEAPWVYKRNGLYYNVFAAQCCSEFIAYSTAPGPTGPWTYRGTVMPTQGSSFTNHAGIVDFKGGSYFFYHNGALPGGGGYTRSVAIEKFAYNSDGTIPRLTMTTAGPPPADTLNPYVRQEAETIAWGSGIETEPASEGGMNIGSLQNGDYTKVRNVAFGTGASSFTARVASAGSGGTIEVRLGSATGTIVGRCAVPNTGGWQTWQSVTCPVSGASGNQDLFLRYTGGSGYLFNVNWWQFSTGGSSGDVTSQLRGVGSNRCVDVDNASTALGTTVLLWDCGTGANQQWTTTPSGEVRVFVDRCLDAYEQGTTNGTRAVIWSCNGQDNQKWTLGSDGSIRNVRAGLCLDADGAATANGTRLILWTCNGQNNQKWNRV